MALSMVETASEQPKSATQRRFVLYENEESKTSSPSKEVEPKPYKHPTNGAPTFHWPVSPMHVEYFIASPMGDFFYKIGWSPNHVRVLVFNLQDFT